MCKAAQLRSAGFTGVACILGPSNAEEIRQLEAQPGVDMADIKGFYPEELAERLLEALAQRRMGGGTEACPT